MKGGANRDLDGVERLPVLEQAVNIRPALLWELSVLE
jgi:hypothetical protein